MIDDDSVLFHNSIRGRPVDRTNERANERTGMKQTYVAFAIDSAMLAALNASYGSLENGREERNQQCLQR